MTYKLLSFKSLEFPLILLFAFSQRQYRNSGSKTLPNGIVATRPSKLEMRPLWYSGINHVCEVFAASTHPFIV
jgi:hypothetical protein